MRCVLGKGKAGNWVMLSTCLKMSRLMSMHSLVLRDFLNVLMLYFQISALLSFSLLWWCPPKQKNKWIYENKRDPIANSTISCKHTWKCTCKHTNLHIDILNAYTYILSQANIHTHKIQKLIYVSTYTWSLAAEFTLI